MGTILLRSKMDGDPGIRPSIISVHVEESQEQHVLRVASYRRHDPEEAHVASVESYEHDSIRQFIAHSFNRDTVVPAGTIEGNLPLVMIHMLVLELDLATLFAFRDSNNSARDLASGVPQFRTAVTVALDLVCILLRTQAARHVTLGTLYKQLCKNECDICHKEWGTFIHLLSCQRACATCIKQYPPKMVSMASAKSVLRLPNRVLQTLPSIYTLTRSDHQPSVKIVQLELLLLAYEEYHDGALVPAFLEGQLDMSASYASQSFAVAPTYTRRTKTVEKGVSCRGCRLNCVVNYDPNPMHGGTSRVKYEGIEDSEKDQAIQAERTVYTKAEFLEHFSVCGPAQKLWKERQA